MWILDYITNKPVGSTPIEQGSIKGSLNGLVEVNASSSFPKIPVAVPFGIASVPPEGESSVVASVGNGDVCLGVLAKDKELKPGEIMLFSQGGATLKLSNDGHVYINGVMY